MTYTIPIRRILRIISRPIVSRARDYPIMPGTRRGMSSGIYDGPRAELVSFNT